MPRCSSGHHIPELRHSGRFSGPPAGCGMPLHELEDPVTGNTVYLCERCDDYLPPNRRAPHPFLPIPGNFPSQERI